MTEALRLQPIAYLHCDFSEKFGLPRQSGRVKSLVGTVVFEKEYSVSEAVRGIEDFSHIWLLWGFSGFENKSWSPTVRPPRLGGNRRIGVFATRSPNRPNPIGMTVVKLEEIRRKNGQLQLIVSGIDMMDGTPIYDIKPYIPFADSVKDATAGFAGEGENYHLEADVPEELLQEIPEEKRTPLLECLKEDPRPAYQKDEREYGISYAGFQISFYVENNKIIHLTGVERRNNK